MNDYRNTTSHSRSSRSHESARQQGGGSSRSRSAQQSDDAVCARRSRTAASKQAVSSADRLSRENRSNHQHSYQQQYSRQNERYRSDWEDEPQRHTRVAKSHANSAPLGSLRESSRSSGSSEYQRENSQAHYSQRAAQRRSKQIFRNRAIAAVLCAAVLFGLGFFVARPAVGSFLSPASSTASQSAETTEQGTSAEEEQAAAEAAAAAKEQAKQESIATRSADFAVDPNNVPGSNSVVEGEKVVYLTIDDGPSELTPKFLDVLDEYNVKATFFVTGHDPSSAGYIKETFDRGHTIGLHTYSHDYAKVYSSDEAYFEDLDAIGEVVKEQIGFVPCFIRFPGGSSNGISADFSKGIMSRLVDEVHERGYQYYDWNCSVGDGDVHTAEEVLKYGTDCSYDTIVLLCHDSATKQTTLDALPGIIQHYQDLGYEFRALDRNSYTAHHGVNN